MIRYIILIFLTALMTAPPAAHASEKGALFDIEARRAELQTPEYATIRSYCMAESTQQPADEVPQPIDELKETKEYGTDNSMEDYSYYLMIHSGRALAGDEVSREKVKKALVTWAEADALKGTKKSHDTYYPLKRGLLAIITSYEIVRKDMSSDEEKAVRNWINPLVKRIDAKFDKEVDLNNHRYLADAVLTLWGDVTGNEELYEKGKERFDFALSQMTKEGDLPLESRRGARALWYARQSLANLSMIATIYQRNGESLYEYHAGHASLPLLMNYFITGVHYPFTLLANSAQNHIPGHSSDFFEQDMGMLERRGHGRHYMAFAHMYLAGTKAQDASHQRLQMLMQEYVNKDLPLIDEFAGGNATCFWGTP